MLKKIKRQLQEDQHKIDVHVDKKKFEQEKEQ